VRPVSITSIHHKSTWKVTTSRPSIYGLTTHYPVQRLVPIERCLNSSDSDIHGHRKIRPHKDLRLFCRVIDGSLASRLARGVPSYLVSVNGRLPQARPGDSSFPCLCIRLVVQKAPVEVLNLPATRSMLVVVLAHLPSVPPCQWVDLVSTN